MNYRKKLAVKPGNNVNLAKIDPNSTDETENKASAEAKAEKHEELLGQLQYLLYSENKRSLLICLQGLDAAGKDGTIRHVLRGMNPQGTRVHGFKVPSTLEASHDFLWRVHAEVPARGEIVVFNRSQYEDVLVTRVHSLVPKDVWSKRYDLINEFERNLAEAGTVILKFFLHIDEGEQLRRFKQRLDDPERHWKISEADYSERKRWSDYQTAYEDVLSKTSTKAAPWFVIPANHKWFRNLAISEILLDVLQGMNLKTPAPTVDIEAIKRKYHSAEKD